MFRRLIALFALLILAAPAVAQTFPVTIKHAFGETVVDTAPARCGSAWKKDPVSGVIGVEQGPLIPMV
jgi:hypothetical protein